MEIIIECCDAKIVANEKNLKEGVFKPAGWRFTTFDAKEEYRKPTIWDDISPWGHIGGVSRDIYKTFETKKDIKRKYIQCPICGTKKWLSYPSEEEIIKDGEAVEIGQTKSDWEDDLYRIKASDRF